MYNVYGEEEEDGEYSAAAQQNLENSITMNKMKLLKAKMEDMNLNKKVGSYWDCRITELKFYCLSENVAETLLNFTPFLKCIHIESCLS